MRKVAKLPAQIVTSRSDSQQASRQSTLQSTKNWVEDAESNRGRVMYIIVYLALINCIREGVIVSPTEISMLRSASGQSISAKRDFPIHPLPDRILPLEKRGRSLDKRYEIERKRKISRASIGDHLETTIKRCDSSPQLGREVAREFQG